jgi:hypothetical protein
VSSHEFIFSLAVSGGLSRDLLADLVAQVLARAGSPDDGAGTLSEELYAAIVGAAARHPVIDVKFSAAASRLQIVVSSGAGAIWQTSRTIP